MSKSIVLSLEWSNLLALKASKLYYDYDMKNSAKRYIGWFFIAMMQFGVVGALKHDAFGLLFIATLLVVYWYYGRWFFRQKMLQRFYDKMPSVSEKLTFKVDTTGLYHAQTLIPWEEIIKVIVFDDGILTQTHDTTLFFQNSAFENFEDRKCYLEMAKEQGKL